MLNFRRLAGITKTYRHIGRYQEILGVLLKHGFGDLIKNLSLGNYLNRSLTMIGKDLDSEKLSRPQRLRKVCEELGPTFIKLGQMLATRPEILGEDYSQELGKLQDQVQSIPFEDILKIIQKECGPQWKEHFEMIEEKALAAASIAQVHRATSNEGHRMVIKVQRPHIKERISVDLEILHYLAKLMEEHSEEWKLLHPTHLVETFGYHLARELDYEQEMKNLELFASGFKDHRDVYVPKVFRSLSTSKVIVMEYVEGIRATDILTKENDEDFDLRKLASKGARIFMDQVFRYGYYHADPHAGNIILLPNHVICFLDFGMIGRISRRDREVLIDLANAVVMNREERVVEGLLKLCESGANIHRNQLEMDVKEIMDYMLGHSLENISMKLFMKDLMQLLKHHHLVLRPQYLMLLRAVVTLEAMARHLDPDFLISEHLKPYLKRFALGQMRPERMAEWLHQFGEEMQIILKECPSDFRELVKRINSGELSVDFQHKGLQPLGDSLDRVANRLSFAVILSSLIIGSSIILHAGIPPKWHGVPVVGLVGFIAAGIIAFFLLFSMIKKHRKFWD